MRIPLMTQLKKEANFKTQLLLSEEWWLILQIEKWDRKSWRNFNTHAAISTRLRENLTLKPKDASIKGQGRGIKFRQRSCSKVPSDN